MTTHLHAKSMLHTQPSRLPVPVGRHPGHCLLVTAPSAQHNTIQHNTTQHNTTQHNTTQHNTTQHNATQHTDTNTNTNTQHQHQHQNKHQHSTAQHSTAQQKTQNTQDQYNTTQAKATQHTALNDMNKMRLWKLPIPFSLTRKLSFLDHPLGHEMQTVTSDLLQAPRPDRVERKSVRQGSSWDPCTQPGWGP